MRRLVPAIAAPWVVWAIGRTLGLDRVHPLVAIVAFTPYAALTSPLPVLVALAFRRWVVAAVAAVAAIALAAAVVPRAIGGAEEPTGGPQITVMASNLLVGGADTGAVLDLVRREDVDLLVLVELTRDALTRLDRAGLADLLPAREARPEFGGTGSGIFAKGEIRALAGEPTQRLAGPAGDVRLPGGGPVIRLRAAHPVPPIGADAVGDWRALLRDLPLPQGTAILAGDFNATLDHRDFRALLDRGWRDAADVVGEGLAPTWPLGRRMFPLVIDHVLVGPGIRVLEFDTHEIAGSDHRAVVARLALPAR